MKRLLSYSLVCLSLFVVLTAISTYTTPNFSTEKSGKTVVHNSGEFYLSTAKVPNQSAANEILKTVVGSETTSSFRNTQDFLFRIVRSERLAHQYFLITSHKTHSQRASLHESGYYLFRLRKLLI